MADEQTQATQRSAAAVAAAPSGPGFFTIHKRGQGYWTRMGTAFGAALICVMLAQFTYSQMKAIPVGKTADGAPTYIGAGVCVLVALGIFAALSLLAWRVMNKPGSVDFLIATDNEMKKVNWTTRKELIGSTKVVIFFVILISAILFLLDVGFGYLFYLMKVLVIPPL